MTTNDILSRLISFKTTEDSLEQKEKCLEFIVGNLGNIPYKVSRSKGVPIICIGETNLKKTKILLLAHLDVVKGKETQFNPKVSGNKVIGRGATDDKGPATGLFFLLKRVYDKVSGVTLIYTFDEEVGSQNGARLIQNKFSKNLEIAFVPDCGGDFYLCKGSLGVTHIKLTRYGKSEHASDANLGVNAIERLVDFYDFLKKLSANKKYSIHATNLGKIAGGEAANSVPAECEGIIDIRYKSTKNFKMLLNKLHKKAGRGKYKIKIETLLDISEIALDLKNPLFKGFKQHLRKSKVFKGEYLETSSNDARFLTSTRTAIILTKPKGGGAHSDDEWCDVKSIEKYINVTESFLLSKFK
jgi:succinyl-diaminopimelate desuccinylase